MRFALLLLVMVAGSSRAAEVPPEQSLVKGDSDNVIVPVLLEPGTSQVFHVHASSNFAAEVLQPDVPTLERPRARIRVGRGRLSEGIEPKLDVTVIRAAATLTVTNLGPQSLIGTLALKPSDKPVTQSICAPGTRMDCDAAGASWTGIECCIRATEPLACVPGDRLHCNGDGATWTGALCCIADTVVCSDGNALDCRGDDMRFTGQRCCLLE
jgi:hypothetical protein